MDRSFLDRIKNELKDKHIYVSDEWLDQVLSEQTNGYSRDFNYFYKRWLNTNLLELDYSNMNIPQFVQDKWEKFKILNLTATFQIIQVNDASRTPPNEFCEDLYKRPKNEFDDEIDNPTEDNQQTNRTIIKSTNRQLILELFNGKQVFRAFEYEPINHLNFDNCFIGAKIILRGELLISLGVLLLRPRNISPLGGIRLTVDETLNIDENSSNQINNTQQINNRNPINNQIDNQINSRN